MGEGLDVDEVDQDFQGSYIERMMMHFAYFIKLPVPRKKLAALLNPSFLHRHGRLKIVFSGSRGHHNRAGRQCNFQLGQKKLRALERYLFR